MVDLPGVAHRESEFAHEVRDGLSKQGQKELPSRYFYDAIGSALFEAITLLPEYGLTRADARLIERHAEEITGRFCPPLAVAELGSGSGAKTRWILEALARREAAVYYPIDISAAALAHCCYELGRIASVVPLELPYLEGLKEAVSRRARGQALLVLFLGSTIGNFTRDAARAFLRDLRAILAPGDALLLGADLEKPVPEMLLAYDDPTGVTAAFNLNLLGRINRELGADFDLRRFAHEARWNPRERRIEMHLRSTLRQRVAVHTAGFTCEFAEAETIWTEACHKFRPEEIREWAEGAGFACDVQWIDPEWAFAESLLIVR